MTQGQAPIEFSLVQSPCGCLSVEAAEARQNLAFYCRRQSGIEIDNTKASVIAPRDEAVVAMAVRD